MGILNYVITILALSGTILAWIAKIKWSREYKEAKEAEIKAKNAQMEAIREKVDLYESIISKKLIDYSKQTISDLEALVEKTKESQQQKISDLLKKIKESEDSIIKKYGSNGEFSAFTALTHSLRTPINGIMGFTTLLEDATSEEERIELSNYIRESAESLVSVYDDMLQLIATYSSINEKL